MKHALAGVGFLFIVGALIANPAFGVLLLVASALAGGVAVDRARPGVRRAGPARQGVGAAWSNWRNSGGSSSGDGGSSTGGRSHGRSWAAARSRFGRHTDGATPTTGLRSRFAEKYGPKTRRASDEGWGVEEVSCERIDPLPNNETTTPTTDPDTTPDPEPTTGPAGEHHSTEHDTEKGTEPASTNPTTEDNTMSNVTALNPIYGTAGRGATSGLIADWESSVDARQHAETFIAWLRQQAAAAQSRAGIVPDLVSQYHGKGPADAGVPEHMIAEFSAKYADSANQEAAAYEQWASQYQAYVDDAVNEMQQSYGREVIAAAAEPATAAA